MGFENRKFLFDLVNIIRILDIDVEVCDTIALVDRGDREGATGNMVAVDRVGEPSGSIPPSSIRLGIFAIGMFQQAFSFAFDVYIIERRWDPYCPSMMNLRRMNRGII